MVLLLVCQVRAVSRELGLPNWNHAASPCLRSRLAFGVEATPERLVVVEKVCGVVVVVIVVVAAAIVLMLCRRQWGCCWCDGFDNLWRSWLITRTALLLMVFFILAGFLSLKIKPVVKNTEPHGEAILL